MKPSKSKSLYILVSEDTWHYIYAFSTCHAVQIWLRSLDAMGVLSDNIPKYTVSKVPNFLK